MYSLFVSGDETDWNGKAFIISLDRCVREYTDKSITDMYGELTQSQIEEVARFPCIFAYETGVNKDPKFGLIRDIERRHDKVRVDYEIINLASFLTAADIAQMHFELDISEWEMNRTHWALKDVNLAKELNVKKIVLPQGINRDSKSVDITKHYFDVALSFPGEIRSEVEAIVTELEGMIGPNAYFYDSNYKAQLARPSMDTLLQDIYANRSKLIVVFLCQKYQEKDWCGLEFRAVRNIILRRENGRIMFIKMDDGKVEGVLNTDGYLNGRTHSPRKLAEAIKERIDLI